MQREPGRVRLVGAGPGAADLLTVRALRAIEGAQALLYDALVETEVLALAPARCVRIQTGKRAGKTSMHQDEINTLMLSLARKGLEVVRLKGGDPSVFGRVGEEKMFLEAHGIEVEIVPGITAASAAAAQFGLPLTHRNVGRRLVLATASLSGGELSGDWRAAADREASLAVYMGRDKAAAVCAELVRLGRPSSTPAVAVENAGRANARAVHASLATLAGELAAVTNGGPVVLLIGDALASGRQTERVIRAA